MILLIPNNIVHGKLLISGRDTLTGEITHNCRPSDDSLLSDFQYIDTTPVIYMLGSCQDTTSMLLLNNSVFKDLSLYTNDVKIMNSAITNVQFLTKTRLTNPYFHLDYLLSLNYDGCQSCVNAWMKNVSLINCTFKDLQQPEQNPTESTDLNKAIYRTGGLQVDGFKYLQIIDNNFSNLDYGLATFNLDSLLLTGSVFDSCGIGNYDYGSYTYLCSDSFHVTQYGTFLDRSRTGEAFDNAYNITRSAFTVNGCDEERFRNNRFDQYLIGIDASCTHLWLTDKLLSGNTYELYGRNYFHINQFPIVIDSNYINRFIAHTCDTLYSSDIHLHQTCCPLNIQCGRNQMSQYAIWHIRYDGIDTYPPNSIYINGNVFPSHLSGIYSPRANPSNIIHVPWGSIDNTNTDPLPVCCGEIIPDNFSVCLVTHGSYITCYPFALNMMDGSIAKRDSLDSKELLATYISSNDEKSLINPDPVLKSLFEKEQQKVKKSDKVLSGSASGFAELRKTSNPECNETQIPNFVYQNMFQNELALEQNRPNPFDEKTQINYYLPTDCRVTLIIRDVLGNAVLSLANGNEQGAGFHTVTLSSSVLAPGFYICSLSAENKVLSIKMYLMK